MKRNARGQFIRGTNGQFFEGYGIWDDSKGYPMICVAGREVRLHVYVWERANGPKPQGYVVHHKDWNKANWTLDNLELVTHSDHLKIHAGWLALDGQWVAKPCTHCEQTLPLDAFYPRGQYTPSALCKACHNNVIKMRERDPAVKQRRNAAKLRWYHQNKDRYAR